MTSVSVRLSMHVIRVAKNASGSEIGSRKHNYLVPGSRYSPLKDSSPQCAPNCTASRSEVQFPSLLVLNLFAHAATTARNLDLSLLCCAAWSPRPLRGTSTLAHMRLWRFRCAFSLAQIERSCVAEEGEVLACFLGHVRLSVPHLSAVCGLNSCPGAVARLPPAKSPSSRTQTPSNSRVRTKADGNTGDSLVYAMRVRFLTTLHAPAPPPAQNQRERFNTHETPREFADEF